MEKIASQGGPQKKGSEVGFIGTPAAAEYLGISPRTLEKLRVTGGGPAFYKVRRRCLYRLAELEAWALEGRRGSTSDTGAVRAGIDC